MSSIENDIIITGFQIDNKPKVTMEVKPTPVSAPKPQNYTSNGIDLGRMESLLNGLSD
jgi:hypothetical protein